MKKTVLLIIVIILSVFFSSCSDGGNSTHGLLAKFHRDDDSGIVTEISVFGEGDLVLEQLIRTTMDYSVLKVSNSDQARDEVGDIVKIYSGLQGLVYDIEYKEDYLVETVKIDYKKADNDKLQLLPSSSVFVVAEGEFKLNAYRKKLLDLGFVEID